MSYERNLSLQDVANDAHLYAYAEADYFSVEAEDTNSYVSGSFTDEPLRVLQDALRPLTNDEVVTALVDSNGKLATVEVFGSLIAGLYVTITDTDDDDRLTVTLSPEDSARFLGTVLHEYVAAVAPDEPEDDKPAAQPTTETEVETQADERDIFNMFVVQHAANNGKTLHFSYAKSDTAPIEKRTLTNVSVLHTDEGNYLASGDDPDRNDKRAFRVDRMKGYASLS